MKRIALALSGFLVGAVACAAPFDCGKSTTDVEKMICSSPALMWDDRLLNALYRLTRTLAPNEKSRFAAEQRQWLKESRDRCKTIECLHEVYQSRSNALRQYVNTVADPIPTNSKWEMKYAPVPNPRPEECGDSFEVGFARLPSRQVIGIWEASAFCRNFLNGGMVEVHENGRIYDIRILGGRGPSHHVGVALLAAKGDRIYVANMFERSSVGAQGDTEYFGDVVLKGGLTNEGTLSNDYGETTVNNLEAAWQETEDSARKNGNCPRGQDINVCMRRSRP